LSARDLEYGNEGDLKLSRLLSLMEIALTRRPITMVVLAPLFLYLPTYLIERYWPDMPENVWSLAFVWWSIQVLPPYSITSLFSAWIALQLFPGAQDGRSQLVHVSRRSPALTSASMLIGFGMVVGSMLLLIPGMIVGLMCTVVMPAIAIEKANAIGGIRRSVQLTKGRLWAILGYGLVVMMPLAAIAFVLELSLVDWDVRRIDQDPFVNNVLKPVTDAVRAAINAALTAAIYFELVRLNASSDTIAETFD
jgi:hypothetical protein